MLMDMKMQGSRSGKALGIGELLASAYSASAPLDRSTMHPYVCFLRGAKTTNSVSHIQIKSANKQVRYVIIKKSKRRDV